MLLLTEMKYKFQNGVEEDEQQSVKELEKSKETYTKQTLDNIMSDLSGVVVLVVVVHDWTGREEIP
jgi:hypothetical protein